MITNQLLAVSTNVMPYLFASRCTNTVVVEPFLANIALNPADMFALPNLFWWWVSWVAGLAGVDCIGGNAVIVWCSMSPGSRDEFFSIVIVISDDPGVLTRVPDHLIHRGRRYVICVVGKNDVVTSYKRACLLPDILSGCFFAFFLSFVRLMKQE